MKLAPLTPLLLAAPVLAHVIPVLDDIVSGASNVLAAVDHLLHPDGEADQDFDIPELTVTQGYSEHHGGFAGICTLKAKGGDGDDTDNFINTMKRCGKNSVVFMNSPV